MAQSSKTAQLCSETQDRTVLYNELSDDIKASVNERFTNNDFMKKNGKTMLNSGGTILV